MPLTARFSISPACPGGHHFDATLTFLSGQAVTIPIDRSRLRDPLTLDEARQFAEVLLRLYVRQMAGQGAGQIKAAVETKVLDLTVIG